MYSSLDILYVVLSVCVIVITVCVAWAFVYILVILKRFRDVQKAILDKVNAVGRVFETVREKIEHSSSHIALLVDLATRAFEYVKRRKKSAAKRKNERQTDFE